MARTASIVRVLRVQDNGPCTMLGEDLGWLEVEDESLDDVRFVDVVMSRIFWTELGEPEHLRVTVEAVDV